MDEIQIIGSIKIDNINDFAKEFGYNGLFMKLSQQGYIFRGHSKSSYELLPTALRKDKKDELWNLIGGGMPIDNQSEWESWQVYAEYMLLQRFYRECDVHGLYIPENDRFRKHTVTKNSFDISFISDEEKWLPHDLHGIAGLAQHYGLPTRLLDWSSDYWTSLYFSVIGVMKRIGEKSFDDKDYMEIWALNASFVDFISLSTEKLPLTIIRPRYYGNTNLSAQKGLFTFWEIDKPYIDKKNPLSILSKFKFIDRTPLDKQLLKVCPQEKDYNHMLYKIRISYGLAKEIYRYLQISGYGASKHFPGYNGVVNNLKEDSYLN